MRARTRISEEKRPRLSNRLNPQELVILVHNLHEHAGKFDIESTLVEVDGPSLMKLIVCYKCLTERVGQSPNFEETGDILETMIEDARRLCSRSPILFRMSTRNRIIRSKNTRYGTNHGRQFTTITTSRGIAAYFNSLDVDTKAQKFIRPRFLQMLVVLLSPLNDDDLRELQEFLEHTYRFKANRADIELLIINAILMSSIKPKVFVTSLVPAFEGYIPNVRPYDTSSFQHYWDTFIRQIVKRG
ncbi:hypothetical protein MGN70_002452 [Eutypa lata]|nr:hypothetical protein MGN70_002452 [Eutypa lata]